MSGISFDTKVKFGHPPGTNGNWSDVGSAINSGLQSAIQSGLDYTSAQKEAFGKFAEAIAEHLDPERAAKLNSLESSIGISSQIQEDGREVGNAALQQGIAAQQAQQDLGNTRTT